MSMVFVVGIYPVVRVFGQTPVVRRGQTYRPYKTTEGLNGVIAGTVRYANGKPASDYLVWARFAMHASGAPGEGSAVTDANGHYSLQDISATPYGGCFVVTVDNENKPFIPRSAVSVKLTEQVRRVENIDFILDNGPIVAIRVRDAATGKPVPSVTVYGGNNNVGAVNRAGSTDGDGRFDYHSASLETELHLDESKVLLDANPMGGPYHHVTLKPGQTDTWNALLYHNTNGAHVPITVRGIVTTSDGKPAAHAKVRLLRDQYCQKQEQTTRADRQGAFLFETESMSEFADTNGAVLTAESATGETGCRYIFSADAWNPIPVRVSKISAAVCGTVLDPKGNSLAGVPIRYYAQFVNLKGTDTNSYYPMLQQVGGVTDANGHFQITGLFPEASYHFTAGGLGGNNRAFGATEFPQDADKPRYFNGYLRPHSGEQKNLGIVRVWQADSVVAGRLQDTSGKLAAEDVLVLVHGDHTSVCVPANKDGTFRLEPVVNEPLTLCVVYGDGHTFSYSDGFSGYPVSDNVVYRAPVQAGDTQVTVTVVPRKTVKPVIGK